MIYTVTVNPSIDYVMHIHSLQSGRTNRSDDEHYSVGGKGINVSVILSRLGVRNQALGFAAGFVGQEIVRQMSEMGLDTDFILMHEGCSRINVKLKSDAETEINAAGPAIDKRYVEMLVSKLHKLSRGDTLVLAGSIPPSMPEDLYCRLLRPIAGRGIRLAVDATGKTLTDVLPFHPFVIKPNRAELEEIAGRRLDDEASLAKAAHELQRQGAGHVLISLGAEGALLVSEDGTLYRAAAFKGSVQNSVGAGDSMLAGFLAGMAQSGDLEQALRLGSAAGSATAFSSELARAEDITALLQRPIERL